MKIKKEKEFTLPQLIEWAMANDVRVRKFRSKNGYCVCFDRNGFIYFDNSRIIPLDQTFTVEVEEEITEDTVFDYLIRVCNRDRMECLTSVSIESTKVWSPLEYHALIDGRLQLIWTKEKGMVK